MIHQAEVNSVEQWEASRLRRSTYNLLLPQRLACEGFDTYSSLCYLFLNGLPGPNIQMFDFNSCTLHHKLALKGCFSSVIVPTVSESVVWSPGGLVAEACSLRTTSAALHGSCQEESKNNIQYTPDTCVPLYI